MSDRSFTQHTSGSPKAVIGRTGHIVSRMSDATSSSPGATALRSTPDGFDDADP